jgi:hypothetical protein
MADQARALGYSVAYISAIERDARPIPTDYPDKVANWLQLSREQTQELQDLARKERKVVQVLPADGERAVIAQEFADRLNETPIEKLRRLRKLWASTPSAKHSVEDLRQLASLARACFDLGNKLTFKHNRNSGEWPSASRQRLFAGSCFRARAWVRHGRIRGSSTRRG